jgi:hypothetical protein
LWIFKGSYPCGGGERFDGNTGGFSTEDDAGFCHFSSFSLSLSISISPYISLYGGGWRRGGLMGCEPMEKGGGGEWLPAAAVMVV